MKSSAFVATHRYRVHLDISEENHLALCRKAVELGLTCNQALNFLLNWSRAQGVLTPEDDGKIWEDTPI